jgi:PadR family transcriptional regulator, regulatory protein AphA
MTMSPRIQDPLSVEYILLGLIDRAPIHGYDLFKKFNNLESVSLVWQIKQSKLYALLDKLEGEGLLQSEKIQGEAYPLRKEFHITNPGRQAFYAWMTNPVHHGREMRQDFLAKLYFALNVSSKIAGELIEGQIDICSGWLADVYKCLSTLEEDQQFERMVYRFRLSQIESFLEWLEACRIEIAGEI